MELQKVSSAAAQIWPDVHLINIFKVVNSRTAASQITKHIGKLHPFRRHTTLRCLILPPQSERHACPRHYHYCLTPFQYRDNITQYHVHVSTFLNFPVVLQGLLSIWPSSLVGDIVLPRTLVTQSFLPTWSRKSLDITYPLDIDFENWSRSTYHMPALHPWHPRRQRKRCLWCYPQCLDVFAFCSISFSASHLDR